MRADVEPLGGYQPHAFDFFSAKLTVLETIDFEAVRIDVFVIELDSHDLPKNWKITRLLHNLDYCE